MNAQLPAGPPLVTPGERMSYRVSLQGVELASLALGVGDLTEVDGKKAVVIQSHAKSVGLAEMIAHIDDHFTSWLDVTSGRPLRFEADEYTSNSKTDIEHSVTDLAKRDGDKITVMYHLNDAAPAPEPQKVSGAEAWDYLAFLIALRRWEGAVGSTVTMEIMRSRYLWHVEMKIGGKEKLTTELGDFPALRLEGFCYKLDRDGNKFPGSDERNYRIWISDDEGRVPLKISARTDYGDVKMEIVDYQPGSGQRLR
jgi:hypothetical protein